MAAENFTSNRYKRIVNGQITKINKYPFQVALIDYNKFLCSGSIIKYNFILTVAHCFDDEPNIDDIIVRAGSTNNMKDGFTSKIKEIIVHEKYNDKNYDYDIALMKLIGKGFYNQINKGYISIINLPNISHFQMKPKPNFAHLAGWGSTDESTDSVKILREIKLQIITQKACKIMYINDDITSRMFCAGYIEGGKDACQGDSGGPLVINNNTIIGMVSWGDGCGRELLPSLFTNVYCFRNWIYKWIK